MLYSYNGLWRILKEQNLTKTEMRKRAGISTNTLAKMGKGNPVALDSLSKICNVLQCELSDIVEIEDSREAAALDCRQFFVSSATLRNWDRLGVNQVGKLTMRANKRQSSRRVLPLEYISNTRNTGFIHYILDYIDTNNVHIVSVIFTLGVNLLSQAGISRKKNVVNVLNEYSDISVIDELLHVKLPCDEFDILGLVYQSYLQEGVKNTLGSYYTPQKVVLNMTNGFSFSNGELYLDPCCGSGAFLLSVPATDPRQLFGIDNDRIAVLISKINLLLKYSDIEFEPQVYCMDYLDRDSELEDHFIFKTKFDYIATNPPWGAVDNWLNANSTDSKESFSRFFMTAFGQLKKGGIIRFLFPEAFLNVKAHRAIRKFIIEHTRLVRITVYDESFACVTTRYIDIECWNSACQNTFEVINHSEKSYCNTSTVYETENLVFNLLSDSDMSIVESVKNIGQYSLKDSIWALGIVTGDNKGKLFPEYHEGMEKIYTGKEILPYKLKPAQNYILYDRSRLQQVAKDEIYRAPEKLVYKFISKKLVFAYDDSSSLFLNSANILIPNIPSMNTKSVMAFLNSTLFQFLYLKLFGEVKILKGNLMELPFPEISATEDRQLSALVDDVLRGDVSKKEIIDSYIFSICNLNSTQISFVRRQVNGKANQGAKSIY